MEIILKFNSDNSPSKYSELQNEEIIKKVRWVVNCALAAIDDSYKIDSIRYIEMSQLHENLMNQIKSQLTQDQITNILET